jgi:hypothetical protein
MDRLINWITDLNRSNHTGFALLTVMTMVSFGGLIAGLIELIFAALGIRWDRSGNHR